jgi:hypothetical protein
VQILFDRMSRPHDVGLSMSTSKRKTNDEWNDTVDKMAARAREELDVDQG